MATWLSRPWAKSQHLLLLLLSFFITSFGGHFLPTAQNHLTLVLYQITSDMAAAKVPPPPKAPLPPKTVHSSRFRKAAQKAIQAHRREPFHHLHSDRHRWRPSQDVARLPAELQWKEAAQRAEAADMTETCRQSAVYSSFGTMPWKRSPLRAGVVSRFLLIRHSRDGTGV